MNDLIDRAALLKSLEYNPLKRSIVQPKSTFGIILSAPAVDAVEVVRCKDCKYNRLTNGSIKVKSYSCNCTWSPCRGRIVEPSFFCFYGERKTE